MSKLWFKVSGSRHKFLVPSDAATVDALQKYKVGDIVSAVVKRPRHPKHHRKLFAMLGLVHEASAVQDRYAKVENLLDALKHAMGHVEVFQAVNGDILTKPKSIAFESMAQDEFEEFYAQAVEIITTRILPHMNREDLEREVLEMVK